MPPGHRQLSSHADGGRRARLGTVALGLGTLVTLAAGAVLARAVVSTASARISGATVNPSSLMQAAEIDLDTGTPAAVAIDARGLFPGLAVERCVQLRYTGSLDTVDLVLSAEVTDGSGLDRYVRTTVTTGAGDDPGCGDFSAGDRRFDDTLLQLATTHPRYERGLGLAELSSGRPTTVRLELEVLSDNRAQGLDTDVDLTFEVRP